MKFFIIEKKEKHKKFTDSQLLTEIDKEYKFDEKKSNNNKSIFSKTELKKNVSYTYLVLIISLVLHIIGLTIIFNIENDSDGLVTIGSIVLLSAIVHGLVMITLPFWFKKELIFNKEKGLIQTKTLVGLKTTRININNIYRIVQNVDKQYSYYTFRERKNDLVSEKSPILVVKAEDVETIEALNTFFDNNFPKISLEKITNNEISSLEKCLLR
ncbi:hypothetical protein [Maribacter aurantiacus]|uniref:Uncharacterized protein n=1 Tax=Maribacter aurantiacus TaxID=1882343 RepID=A0A5R8M345_9FLAO|nr:hypothetical protein [Maribacter aurantiacus]TLF43993.1 hypothetical protein FEK29_13020 [Maribacter aurantiacus]